MLRVSVLIPAYNHARFLPDAIECLLKQTRRPDEIVVVDDGSTDDTASVLEHYADQIIAVRQENRGASAARNTAYKCSTGDLIAFLDGDDTLEPTSIEKRAACLENNPALDFVYTGAYMTDLQGQPLQWFRRPPLPSGNVFAHVICRHLFPIHAVMFRRSIVQRDDLFDARYRSAEDLELWSYLLAERVVTAINEPLAFYRSHPDMMTKRMDIVGASLVSVQEQIMRMPAFAKLTPVQKAEFYTWHATYHLYARHRKQSFQYVLRSLRLAPTVRRAYLMLLMSILGTQGFENAQRVYRRASQLRQSTGHKP